MSLMHPFGRRDLATSCYPLRSSQGVGAEWHDGAIALAISFPFLRLADLLLRGCCVLDHIDSRSPPRCRNIERKLALSVLISLLKRCGTANSLLVLSVGSLRRGGPLRYIAQRRCGRAGQVSCRRGLGEVLVEMQAGRQAEEVAGVC